MKELTVAHTMMQRVQNARAVDYSTVRIEPWGHPAIMGASDEATDCAAAQDTVNVAPCVYEPCRWYSCGKIRK